MQVPLPRSRWSALSERLCRCMQSVRRQTRWCFSTRLLSQRPAPWPLRLLCGWAPRMPVLGVLAGKSAKADGPILVDSDVDTDDDSGESGGEPDGGFTVGPPSNGRIGRAPTSQKVLHSGA